MGTELENDMIAVPVFAEENGLHKNLLLDVLKRLNIHIQKLPGGSAHRGQKVACFPKEEGPRVIEECKRARQARIGGAKNPDKSCVFYLLQLEPELAPRRFKVGFASSFENRINKFKPAAPFLIEVGTWPCPDTSWEKKAIEHISRGCKKLHTETFEASSSIDEIKKKCEEYFSFMNKF